MTNSGHKLLPQFRGWTRLFVGMYMWTPTSSWYIQLCIYARLCTHTANSSDWIYGYPCSGIYYRAKRWYNRSHNTFINDTRYCPHIFLLIAQYPAYQFYPIASSLYSRTTLDLYQFCSRNQTFLFIKFEIKHKYIWHPVYYM